MVNVIVFAENGKSGWLVLVSLLIFVSLTLLLVQCIFFDFMISPASSSPSLPFVSSAHAYSIACACTCAQRRILRRIRLGDFKSKRTGTGDFTLSTRSNATNETDDLAESILKNGKITKIAHQLIRHCVREDDVVVDLTCGRGTDTLFFLELVKDAGLIISIDKQQKALDITKKRIREEFCAHISDEAERKKIEEKVYFVRDCHSKAIEGIVEGLMQRRGKKIGACMMNLGYLTGKDTDKSIVTTTRTTLQALDKASRLLRVGGLITICCYRGHEGGQEETDAVLDFASKFPPENFTVTKIDVLNRSGGPILISCYRQR